MPILQKSQTSVPSTISVIELSVILHAVILHEITHSVVIEWTKGLANTPANSPLHCESGLFVEQVFFSGHVECI